jgi:integrase
MGMTYKRGNIWWIKYYRNSKPYYESSGSIKETDAKRLLKKREGEISQGKLPGVYFDRVRFDELAADFLIDYRINGKKSLKRAERSVEHLRQYFEGLRVTQITTARIKAYIEQRLTWTCNQCEGTFLADEVENIKDPVCPRCSSGDVLKGAANATVNRELSALKRMLNLGAQQTPPKVDRAPHIPMLKENNTRKGFFEHGDFLALRDALPSYLKGFVTFAYKTGWRVSEIAGLTWDRVDLGNGIVRLEVGETKNEEARTVYLDEETNEVFFRQWESRKQARKRLAYVFFSDKADDRVKRFDKAWRKACNDAGIGKRYFHDFRRTAVRNMVRSGIPERVAMMISGHKDRSVFERYNIVNDADLRMAAKKQEAYTKSQTVPSASKKRLFVPKDIVSAPSDHIVFLSKLDEACLE